MIGKIFCRRTKCIEFLGIVMVEIYVKIRI
jgi:hypothetical protein